MRSRLLAELPLALLIAFVMIATGARVDAQVVSNPGPITLTFPVANMIFNNSVSPPATTTSNFDFDTTAGPECSDGVNNDDHTDVNQGVQDSQIDHPNDGDCTSATDDSEDKSGFQPLENLTFTGTIDANGNITIPSGNITMPPRYAWSNQGGLGGDRVNINTFIQTHNATGNLNPVTGVLTLRVRHRVRFQVDGTSSTNGPGNNCYMGDSGSPLDWTLTTQTVTSGVLPNMSGVAYNSTTGDVSLVSFNNATIPGMGDTGQCGFLGLGNGPINSAFGLPASSGNVRFTASGSVTPVILPPAPPDLTIAKSHVGDFTVGTQGSYAIDVTNDGTGATTGTITVTDTLPSEMTFASGSGTGWGCSAVSQDVTCTHAGPLAGSASLPTLTLVVNPVSDGSPTNTATVSTQGDTNAANDSDDDPTTINPAPPPDLAITKSHAGDFTVGVPASYSIAVTNLGSGSTVGTITVTDPLPALMTFSSGTGTGWSCGAVGQNVTCTHAGPVAPLAALPTLTLNVDPVSAGSAINAATVSTANDSNAGNNTSNDSTTVNPPSAPDLAIDKSHVGSFTQGSQGVYSIDVENVGNLATTGTITVTDALPGELSFVSGTGTGWSCGAVAQNVTCTHAGPVNASASLPTITLTVDALTPGNITNTAVVSTPGDSDAGNDSDGDPTVINASNAPDLAIDKSHSGTFVAGSQGVYSIDVTNDGNLATSATITVTDTLPAGLTYSSAAGTGWSCGAVAQVVTCTHAGPVNPAASLPTISLTVDVDASGAPGVTNTATVSTTGDFNTANDSDDDPTDVDACPSDPTKLVPGQCGCGTPDTDTDGDGTADCNDLCPNDINKTAPGVCGCGVSDDDTDGDGTEDCDDLCPNDINKIDPGVCGCGVADDDTDGDLTLDCLDGCPNDGNKTDPGDCGCGVPDEDNNGNSISDCLEVPQSKSQQGCILAMNKNLAKVARAQGKEQASCLKAMHSGSITNAQGCFEGDVKLKVSKAKSKTISDELKRCAFATPDFGYSGSEATNDAAVLEIVELAELLFGGTLDSAYAMLNTVNRCQQDISKAYAKIVDAKLKAFNRCKKAGMKAGSITARPVLEECLDEVQADAKGRIAKTKQKLTDRAAVSCTGLPFSTTFPGVCSAGAGFADCVDQTIDCRMCHMLNAADALTADCDLYDDAQSNGSCAPAFP